MGLAVGDIVPHRIVEQHRLLRDNPDLRSQRLQRHIPHIVVVNQNPPAADVKEARDQVHQCALARAARSHHRQHLSHLHFQIDVMQHDRRIFGVLIGERNAVKPDRPGKLPHPLCSRLFPYFVFDIHEAENFGRGSHRLLEIVVED